MVHTSAASPEFQQQQANGREPPGNRWLLGNLVVSEFGPLVNPPAEHNFRRKLKIWRSATGLVPAAGRPGELWSRRLPGLTSSAHGKNPTPQPLRAQQPPCTESAAARPEERLSSLMTIKAPILRANNALFPRSPKSASTRFREQNGATRDPLNCRDICSIRRFVYFECCFYCECPICFSWRSKTHGDTTERFSGNRYTDSG